MRSRPHLQQHPTATPRTRFVSLAILTLCTILTACSSSPHAAPDLTNATTNTATGHWDDLTAALATAQRLHGLAVLTDTTPEPGVRILTLLTNLDHRVTIRTQSTGHTNPRAEASFDIAVTYGLWGDPEKEQAIIQTIQKRLKTLAQRPG